MIAVPHVNVDVTNVSEIVTGRYVCEKAQRVEHWVKKGNNF